MGITYRIGVAATTSSGFCITMLSSSSASCTSRPRLIGDLILPQCLQSGHTPARYSSKRAHRYGPLMESAFCSVTSWEYSGCLVEILWIATPPSTQNLAIDNPALHSGSEIFGWLLTTSLSCSHPLPLMVLIKIVLNRLTKLPDRACIIASCSRGVYFLALAKMLESSPSKSRNSSNPTAAPASPTSPTCRGGSALWLRVSGTRRTRAASAVTEGSLRSPCLTHIRLNCSATGTHVSRETGAVSDQ